MKEKLKKRIKRTLIALGIGSVVAVPVVPYALDRLLPEDRSKEKTENLAGNEPNKIVMMSRQESKKFMEDQRHFSKALQRGDMSEIKKMITEGFNINTRSLRINGSREDAISYLMFDLVNVKPRLDGNAASTESSTPYGKFDKLKEAVKIAKMLVENGFDLTEYKDINEPKRYAHNPFCAITFAQEEVEYLFGGELEKAAKDALQGLYNYLSQARIQQLEKSSQTQNNQIAQEKLLAETRGTYQY